MIHILHVVGTLERGGTEAFIMNMYRHIDRSKIQFDFLVLSKNDSPYVSEITSLGGEIFYGIYPNYKNMIDFCEITSQIMRRKKYYAVHGHLNIMNAWILKVAKWSNIPVRISHSHDTYGKGGNIIYRCVHCLESLMIKAYANNFLACSLEAGTYLYGYSFFRKKGKIVKNGIDVKSFLVEKDNDLAKKIGIPSNCKMVVGNISRFEDKKNQLFIIEIFKYILEKEPKSVLILGGVDGGGLEQCKQRVEKLGLNEYVKFIGVRKDMPDILKLIDVFIFPSLYEGLGIVLLEAQASKCYCVASTECPRDSDMEIGLIDYLSLERKPEEWANHIFMKYNSIHKALISDDDIKKTFKKKEYTIERLVQNMTEIYESVIL